MVNCPERERWELFLEDKLSANEEAILSEHLEDCSECALVLEELTAGASAVAGEVSPQFGSASRSGVGALRDLLPAQRPVSDATAPANAPRIPGFVIERELGRGGMGVVYLARQAQLNRRVALKVILAGEHAAQEHIVRFLAEAQTCASLRHEHIVRIYDVGHHAGLPYYAMEYIDGPNLAERARLQPLTPQQTASLVERLARAMHVAHRQGVIHRDLKPANILIEGGAAKEALVGKITDFGLAKRFEEAGGLTHAAEFLGTPDYMAPEQIDGGSTRLGPPTDVYAFGAILYFLLVGRPPFSAATPLETLAKVKNTEPEFPSLLQRALPRDLSTICLRCLEKSSQRRYSTAEALADDLARFLGGEPIQARPVSEWERLRKWAARNPAVTGLSALLLTVVFTALGLVIWQLQITEQARQRETQRADGEAKARREIQLLSSHQALDRGVQECRAGNIDDGLNSFRQALDLLPAGESDLEFAVRMNLAAWNERRCPVERGPKQGTTVRSVAFSPDGASLVTGNSGDVMGDGSKGQVLLWNARRFTGSSLLKIEHEGLVNCVAYSPSGDFVAVGGSDGTAAVHDTKSGKLRFPPLQHSSAIRSLAFRPDGQELAVGGGTELRIWNATTGEAARPPCVAPFEVTSLAWNPSGELILLGGLDSEKPPPGSGRAILLNLAGEAFGEPMIHDNPVSSVAFHPNGELLATGCHDGFVRLWNFKTQTLSGDTLAHAWPVNSLQFSSNGALLATASGRSEKKYRAGYGEIHIWDVVKRTRVVTPQYEPLSGNSQNMNSVAFSPDDRQVAAASQNGAAWLWTLPPPLKPRLTFKLGERADILYSPEGKRLLLTELSPRIRGFRHRPSTVHVVDPADGKLIASLPHAVSVKTRFRRDGKQFISLSFETGIAPTVHLWDAETGDRLPLPDDFGPALDDVCFPDDGRTAFTIDASGWFRAWNIDTWTPLAQSRPCLKPNERGTAFNNSGTRLLAADREQIRLVSLPECETIAVCNAVALQSAAFTRNQAEVVITFDPDRPQLLRLNATDGKAVATPPQPGERYQTALHLGFGRFLCDLGNGTSSQHWEAAEGRTGVRFPMREQCALHPSGDYLASTEGGVGSGMQLWSLLGKPLGPPIPHAFLHAVEFSPSGEDLVTSSFDGSIGIWKTHKPFGSDTSAKAGSLTDSGDSALK